jgi:hypothetical protein
VRELARFTGNYTRDVAEGLDGIGGIRVISARDGHALEGGGVRPPFVLLCIPDPWVAVVLSQGLQCKETYTAMSCKWVLYPAGKPTDEVLEAVGPERADLLEPPEHLWCLEPMPEGFHGGIGADWIAAAHSDCGLFDAKAAEMGEAAELALALLREDGKLRGHGGPGWDRVLLPAGAILSAQVSAHGERELSPDARRFLDHAEPFARRVLVPFTILEPLVLTKTSRRRAGLASCRCEIPALETTADSVNHAYTLISRAFERSRHAHGGSVFQAVVAKPHPGAAWMALDGLRRAAEAAVAAER